MDSLDCRICWKRESYTYEVVDKVRCARKVDIASHSSEF